jgi:vacuolar-type H+-ATPase subunit E/Vma4
MNQGVSPAPEASMIEKILGDGRAQAERLLESARRSAEAERRKTEAQAEKARREILNRAERKIKTLRSKEIATGHIESKRILLRAREEAIAKIFGTIEQELYKVRQQPSEYKDALRNLALEAVAAIGMSEVVLKVAREDKALIGEAFVEDITARVRSGAGRDVKVALEFDPALSAGGCVAASSDGRIVFDNTFKRRLERMRPALRSVIVREVLKTDG